MSPIDVTQAILVQKARPDPSQGSQRLALFDEDGNPVEFTTRTNSMLTGLTDVTGDPGIGKAPVSDESGEFPLTEVATQAYVDEQVENALSRWAVLGRKLTFVSEISGLWTVTNSTVRLTPDGIVYGPYADGAVGGGSIRFHGLDGLSLSDVRNLAFHMRFTADNAPTEPYSRVFTVDPEGGKHTAIFTPATQAYPGLGPGPFQEWLASSGTWRYDDDSGDGLDSSFDDIKAAHPDDVITSVGITLGFSGGQNLTGLLRWMQINGNRYTFGN